MQWVWKSFDELTSYQVYAMCQLRQAVFIVEQRDCYQDADGLDLNSLHLFGYLENEIAAYARVILPKENEESIHFGRVLVKSEHRKKGIATELVRTILKKIEESELRKYSVQIAAQLYLERFYQKFGFKSISAPYLDGTIPHIDMILR